MNNPDVLFCLIGFGILALYITWAAWTSGDVGALQDYYTADFERGVSVRREPLPEDVKKFFLQLPHDIVTDAGYIKSNGTQVIIVAKADRGRVLPLIAYVNLDSDDPKIEYQTVPSVFGFMLPFVVTVIFIPFMVLWVIESYLTMKRCIHRFIEQQMSENVAG